MIVNGIVMTALTVESISDIKKKSISGARLIVYFLSAIIANIFLSYQSYSSMLGGIFVGIIVLVFGLITGEGIGYGDGAAFICLGAVLGLSENMRLLFFSLVLASIVGGIYSLVKKKGISTQIPFLPCVLVTFIGMTIIEGIL